MSESDNCGPCVENLRFTEFPKIPRLFRECVITEKIDGTNTQIILEPLTSQQTVEECYVTARAGDYRFICGSSNRFIHPGQDNMGFASWVRENCQALTGLGEGRHFGEWWGGKIQRGYGVKDKRLSLFNVAKWGFLDTVTAEQNPLAGVVRVVPTLYRGPFKTENVEALLCKLRSLGSYAAPGFMDPEGIIVFHEAANHCFKVTCLNDEKPKGA